MGTSTNPNPRSAKKSSTPKGKFSNRTKIILALLAIFVPVPALVMGFYVSDWMSDAKTIESLVEDNRPLLESYSEETLDLEPYINLFDRLEGLTATFANISDEDQALLVDIEKDVTKHADEYYVYEGIKDRHESVVESPALWLGTLEERNETFARYQKAIDKLPKGSRFIQPINDMWSEAEKLVPEAERQEAEWQEQAAKEAEEEARRQEEEQARWDAANADKKDQVIINEPGKYMCKITAYSSVFHFTADYSGSGNFIVQLLDSNQNLVDLMANEIGSYHLDRSAAINPGSTYYVLVECNYGSWSGTWTGSYGS